MLLLAITTRHKSPSHVAIINVAIAGRTDSVAWIDVTVGLHEGLVSWPDDPKFEIERPFDMAKGDSCNVSRIALGVHAGTHMDAPEHFIAGAPTMDDMPLKATVGVARVIEIRDPRVIRPEELAPYELREGERILFKTRNSARDWANAPFDRSFVHVGAAAAQYLADARVRTVGIDYLSVGAFQNDGEQTHRILLGAGIWLVEGLDLSKVEPGIVEMIGLPMKIQGAEGAPARVILRPIPVTAAF